MAEGLLGRLSGRGQTSKEAAQTEFEVKPSGEEWRQRLTPEQYREKWSLGADYPMVAPSYAAARSQLAKQMGLGQQRRRRAKMYEH